MSQAESAPAWLVDGSRAVRDAGNGSLRRGPGASTGQPMDRQQVGAGGDGAGGALGYAGGAVGGAGGVETGGEAKNNWQQGLDHFARRWAVYSRVAAAVWLVRLVALSTGVIQAYSSSLC